MFKKINQVYFLADAKEDLKEISPIKMGDECYVIKEACEYKVTSEGEWVKQTPTIASSETDLTGYATESYVDEKIANIDFPKVDLDPYAKKEEIPSVEGLASEKYVDEAIKIATHMDKDYGEAHMFGLMVDSTDGKTLIEAMYEKGKGMYNFHVEKGSPGLPEAVVKKNSSCRGICCVDTLKPTGWYGWIIMFDQDGDMYVQYIRNSEPKGWKEVVNKTEIEKANLAKYDFTALPEGTLIDNSRGKEYRIMCPADATYTKQQVGEGGNPNMYYMTFNAYAPEGAVACREGDKGEIIDEVIELKHTDKYGRKYKPHWFALAMYDEATDTWTYFGKNSNIAKYIGWTYIVEWLDKDGKVINMDKIRINLSNEECHLALEPYFG